MTIRKFRIPAYIHNNHLIIKSKIQRKFLRVYVNNQINWISFRFPTLKTSFQIAHHLIKTYPGHTYHTLSFFPFLGYQDNRFVKGQEAAGPFCKSAIKPDTDRTRYKTLGKN